MTATQEETIIHHFVFGEYWKEYPKYINCMPADGESWQQKKEKFDRRTPSEPQLITLKTPKGEIICVYIQGFGIPDSPLVIQIGTDVAVGRVVLCERIVSREKIAIHY